MPEKTDNPMPKVTNPKARAVLAWISWALLLAGPSLTALVLMLPQGTIHDVAVIVLGGMVSAAAAIKGGLSNPLGKSGTAVVLALVFLVGSGCRSPYDAAWRTMDGLLKARDVTAATLAQAARDKHHQCVKAHGPKTQAYATCIKDHRAALKQWQTVARPAVNSALHVTKASVQIAESAKADKPPDYIALLRPAACALWRVVRAWGHYLPKKGSSVLKALGPFGEGVCHE
jgi:hypothetical protein